MFVKEVNHATDGLLLSSPSALGAVFTLHTPAVHHFYAGCFGRGHDRLRQQQTPRSANTRGLDLEVYANPLHDQGA